MPDGSILCVARKSLRLRITKSVIRSDSCNTRSCKVAIATSSVRTVAFVIVSEEFGVVRRSKAHHLAMAPPLCVCARDLEIRQFERVTDLCTSPKRLFARAKAQYSVVHFFV